MLHKTLQELPSLKQGLYQKCKLKVAHQVETLRNAIDHEARMFNLRMKQKLNNEKSKEFEADQAVDLELRGTKHVIDQLKNKVKKQGQLG